MKNILVLAAFISPTKGSEYSVAWNYVKHMAKYNNLTVVYGASGDVLGDCSEMERYALEHPMPKENYWLLLSVPTYTAVRVSKNSPAHGILSDRPCGTGQIVASSHILFM